MNTVGDASQLDFISQLTGFLRDNTPRRPVAAKVTRIGLGAVNVVLTTTGTKVKAVPMAEGTVGLREGDEIFLLYLEGHRVVGVRPSPLGL